MQCQYPCSGPSTDSMNYITGNVFGISFHFDWQIDNGFQKNPVMAHTHIQVHRWGPERWFQCCFAEGLYQGFIVSSVSQATYFLTWRYFTLLRVQAKIKNTHATTGTVVYLIPWNIMKKSYSQELQEVLHLKEQCHKDIAVLCQFWTEVIT